MTLFKWIPILCFALLLLCSGAAHAKKNLAAGNRPVSTGKSRPAPKWFSSFDLPALEGTSSGAPGAASFVKQDKRTAPARRRRKFSFSPVFEKVVKGALFNFSW
jgi:hypothetical protein